jgi:hypothetical protein
MDQLKHGRKIDTEFATLLARADVAQAAFARLTDVAADAAIAQRAMTRLARARHPDNRGDQAQMARINAAYETACGLDGHILLR